MALIRPTGISQVSRTSGSVRVSSPRPRARGIPEHLRDQLSGPSRASPGTSPARSPRHSRVSASIRTVRSVLGADSASPRSDLPSRSRAADAIPRASRDSPPPSSSTATVTILAGLGGRFAYGVGAGGEIAPGRQLPPRWTRNPALWWLRRSVRRAGQRLEERIGAFRELLAQDLLGALGEIRLAVTPLLEPRPRWRLAARYWGAAAVARRHAARAPGRDRAGPPSGAG